MMSKQYNMKVMVSGAFVLMLALAVNFTLNGSAWAQKKHKPIKIEEDTETLVQRLDRPITLDVREMNILDVVKFLSLKGNFNMITSDDIEGRVTLYLKNVSIKDALDIILISNDLAYYPERDIVYIMTAVEYEAMLGKKFNDKMVVEILNLDYAKPSYVLTALDNIKSALGRIIIDEDTGSVVLIDTKEALVEMKAALVKMERPAEIFQYSLQYAKVEDVLDKIQARIDAHAVGTVAADIRSNKLIVRAQPGRREEVEEIIRALDVPTKEVLIEAKVLQITFKPQYDFGIDWELDIRFNPEKDVRSLDFDQVFLDEGNISSSSNLFTNYGRIQVGDVSTDDVEFNIRALEQVSDTKILSNPKLLVTNNEEAKIHVGDTVPYIISTTSGTGDNAITSEDVRFVDVGLRLNVTPTINDDGYITMRLNPEISTVTTRITSQGGGIPQVNKTEVETTVMVKDGHSIILGGLKKDNKTHVEKGTPYLKDIPWLGKLFSNVSDTIESTEIVIFITPHIMYGNENHEDFELELKASKTKTDEMIEKANAAPMNLERKMTIKN